MNLNLAFYTQNPPANPPTTSNTDKGKIIFDHVNDRIGANGFWFGSTKLPLAGGVMSGAINLNQNAIRINSTTTSYNNEIQYRNAVSWMRRNNRDAVEIGNPFMHLRLATGQGGNLYHYYRNINNGEEWESIILDEHNSKFTATTYGYTVNLGSNSQNLLGIGKLGPQLFMGNEDGTQGNETRLTLKIGGESTSVIISKAESASYAISAGSAGGLVGAYFYKGSESAAVEEGDEIEIGDDNIINTLELIPGASTLRNKIIIGDGIKIEKVDKTTGDITNSVNPNNYNIKISIADEILARIEALEARNNVTFTVS